MTSESGKTQETCPMGCGRETDDPYGGPCEKCWDAAPVTDHPAPGWERVTRGYDRHVKNRRRYS